MSPDRRRGLVARLGCLALMLAGCGTTKVTGTARTATEQLLLTSAWDDALAKIDFGPLAGVPVFLDSQYLTVPVDQGWLISSIRQSMLDQGVLLRAKPEQAQYIVEARVGTYGTNEHNMLIGISQTTIPAIAGLPGGTVPEMPMAKRNRQEGVAKLALYAYDRASGQVTWTSGTQMATATAKDVFIGAIGPIQSGSIREGPEFSGMRLFPRFRGEPPESPPTAAASPHPSSALAIPADDFAP